MTKHATRKRAPGSSRYLLTAILLIAAVLIFGWRLSAWMTNTATLPVSENVSKRGGVDQLEPLFVAAVQHMQQGQYRQALDLWHRTLLLNPDIPEVKVNMGFSLYELGDYATARNFFINAMEQNAFQANAYYGLAISSEKMGDLEGALGAMRSYIHLAANEQEQKFVRRARAAVWEWETQVEAAAKANAAAHDDAGTSGQ